MFSIDDDDDEDDEGGNKEKKKNISCELENFHCLNYTSSHMMTCF